MIKADRDRERGRQAGRQTETETERQLRERERERERERGRELSAWDSHAGFFQIKQQAHNVSVDRLHLPRNRRARPPPKKTPPRVLS